jgi:phage terminase small subunit
MARYYVYALIDPRDLQPFYIGKGTASRRFNHMKKIPNATVGPKGERIQEIQDAGLIVQSAVMSWHATEEEAYEGEKEAIAKIGLDKLTNVAVGGNGDRKPERKSTKAKEVKLTAPQEKFCQLVASGENASASYRGAYDTSRQKTATINRNAKTMMDDTKISARIDELRKPVIEKAKVTLEGLLEKLDKAYEVAETTDQASGMVAAIREIGKLADLYPAEKRVNQNYDMNELQTRIQAGRERLRVVNGGK